MKFNTKAIHSSLELDPKFGSSSIPIFQTASYSFGTAEELADVFQGRKYGHVYSRNTNPTVAAFETKVKELEEGLGSIGTATGMAAIAAATFALTQAGDEFVTSKSVFGGTYHLFEDLRQFGVTPVYVQADSVEQFEAAITDKTRFIFSEAIGNPQIDVPNLNALAALAQAHHIPLIVDATLVTPYLFKAKQWGVSIVVHSATKYMGIGGTTLGGVLTDLGTFNWQQTKSPKIQAVLKKAGPMAFLAKARKQMISNAGATLSPLNAFLLHLGLETLSLRMDRHCDNAEKIAAFLAHHPKVKRVQYAGLETSGYHALAKTQYSGRFGALMSIHLDSQAHCYTTINQFKLIKNQANIGGSKTLAIHPASTIYHECSDEVKAAAGVLPTLIRLSIGLEDAEDLIQDLDAALAAAQ